MDPMRKEWELRWMFQWKLRIALTIASMIMSPLGLSTPNFLVAEAEAAFGGDYVWVDSIAKKVRMF